jgi:DNA helicase II / ATP-dependent DNA helicase PcrA
MILIKPEAWTPVGVNSLEPIAAEVVRSDGNALVVAGPGSGKTELLAQRANYLLETGMCAAPQRILAISFKRDAAANLHDRVTKRSPERAQRFDSYTLDAFAKRLVDRFYPGLTADWRPKAGYEVLLEPPRPDEIREWITSCGFARHKVYGTQDKKIKEAFDKLSSGFPLPYSDPGIHETYRKLGLRWWREQLDRPVFEPTLTFPMINRLAAFLLRTNPKVLRVLRATYRFVFLDEFQDTTSAQYDLIHSAFTGSASILTAVGDGKQRIMLWAGAMVDVFEEYEREFAAKRYPPLVSNYRSAPKLVAIQHLIAKAVESNSPITESKREATGSCEIWEFSNAKQEADILADVIDRAIDGEKKKHRDFCILVRQQTAKIIEPLKIALAARGVKLRDESELQDLLVEPVVQFILSLLRVATRQRDPEAWEKITHEVALLFGLDQEDNRPAIEGEAKRLLNHSRSEISSGRPIELLPGELVSMVSEARFRAAYIQYKNGVYLTNTVTKLALKLRESAALTANATEAVDDLIGLDVIPAMTIHKSKGLEFETVIFVGLEDSQWWSFSEQADEEKRSFFVAFSRAISRVIFTFSDIRSSGEGARKQDKTRIDDLYKILLDAGVRTVDHRK